MDWLKIVHVTAVVISITGFTIRGMAMMFDKYWYKTRTVRSLSATNDTILIVSPLFLANRMNQWPFEFEWLTAKVMAMLVYIGLGMVALHFGKTKKARVIAWLLALFTVTYIVMVARYRFPYPWKIHF